MSGRIKSIHPLLHLAAATLLALALPLTAVAGQATQGQSQNQSQAVTPLPTQRDDVTLPPGPDLPEVVIGEPVVSLQPEQLTPTLDARAGEGAGAFVSTGQDPALAWNLPPNVAAAGPFVLDLRQTTRGQGKGRIYWITANDPQWDERKAAAFDAIHDGQPRDYQVVLLSDDIPTAIRIDPFMSEGSGTIEAATLRKGGPHPLRINGIRQEGERLILGLSNTSESPLRARVAGKSTHIPSGGSTQVEMDASPGSAVSLKIEPDGLPPIERSVWVVPPRSQEATQLSVGDRRILFDGARRLDVVEQGQTLLTISPIIAIDGQAPQVEVSAENNAFTLRGEGVEARFQFEDTTVQFDIRSDRPVEGPVVRVPGTHEQALYPGLEYVGRWADGEHSSSTDDIHTEEYLRFAPPVDHVTWPMMAVITDRAAVAMHWNDPHTQSTFAVPDFIDGTPGSRLSLRGREMAGTILVEPPQALTHGLAQLILWGVQQTGLPEVPQPPRSERDQYAMYLKALQGVLRNENGWGHCVEANWPRKPFADHASCIWRLTGQVPELPSLTPGGAHLPDQRIYFLTGRGQQWLTQHRAAIQQILNEQQPDGSFRYEGPYREGHFEDTASGHMARRAWDLLRWAWQTGDQQSLQAALKALAYMERFRTPRGVQTWELTLHVPDILASAYALDSHRMAYELTGDAAHLEAARRWALTGLPFVYLYGEHPHMKYATIAVFGATNFVAPNWIGRPVQWCGLVYADALAGLAPHDDTLDWEQIARGILVSGEGQVYPDGPSAGTLPDSFIPWTQERHPADINPVALVLLRDRIEGRPVDLQVARSDTHHVIAPFPVTIEEGHATIEAPAGMPYQVLIDGERLIDLTGPARVPLE